ncbi:MAG TPA: LysR substrate-binding domain-containing protein [Stellaceae bacterium]|nr:LysR substrate-binding domain-containing protein [Stellaceae bacterium]
MDVADLRVFETVARLAAMNRAAHELNMVQSNVTARIRLLEQSLGMALFRRHSRGVSLTAAGERLLPYAGRAIQLLDEARQAVTDNGAPQGRLKLGALETTAMLRLPPVLAAYVAAFPAVDLALTTGTTAELVARVLDRGVDGALVCGPVDHPHLVEERVYREQLVIVTASRMRSLDAVLRQRDVKLVVLRLGCSYRQRLEAVLAKRGVVGLRYLEFGTLDAILGCVAAGIGITLLPRSVVARAAHAGRVAIHRLPAAEAQVDTVLIRRRDAMVSKALAAFVECAKEKGRGFPRPFATMY